MRRIENRRAAVVAEGKAMNCADRSLVGRSAVAGRSPAGEERGSRSWAAGSASCIEVVEAVGCSRSPGVAGEAAAVENTAAEYIVRHVKGPHGGGRQTC